MAQTLETSVGRDTRREGGNFIYLASVRLCEVHGQLKSRVYLYYSDCELLQRVVVPHADDCP